MRDLYILLEITNKICFSQSISRRKERVKLPSYEKFKLIIDRLNLKPADVAKGTDISPTVFSDWKSGKSKPKTDKIMAIANFLNVGIDKLIE